MTRFAPARLALAALVAAVSAPLLTSAPTPAFAADDTSSNQANQAEQARSTTDFLNSMGVNVHMSYGGTPYASANNVADALQTLGITHVRENFRATNDAEHQRLDTLVARGVRFDFVAARPDEPDGKNPADPVSVIAARYAGSTDAVEGPNEYDNSSDADWPTKLRTYQDGLRQAVAASPSLSGTPVYGPSLVGYKMKKDGPRLGDLSSALDFGNVHSYPGGVGPEAQVGQQSDIYGQDVSMGKPAVATETGYHNAVHNTHASGHPSASEGASAVYLPRLYLEYFRRGISRTYAYELFNLRNSDDQSDNFGFFRTDGSPKPAATTVGNLSRILADTGGAGASDNSTSANSSDTLHFGISDSDGNAGDVRHVLLRKPDGSFYLALWRVESVEQPGSGGNAPQAIAAPSAPVTVALGQPIASAEQYRPSAGTDPTAQKSNPNAVTLPLGPDVTLLRLDPPGTPAPPATSPAGGQDPTPSTGPAEPPASDNGSGAGSGTDGNGTDGTGGNGTDGNGSGDSGGGSDTPAPAPGQPSLPRLPVIQLPVLGTTNFTPIHVSGSRRVLAPMQARRLRWRTFDVDGVPMHSDVLAGQKLQPGRHILSLVGQAADGTPVMSAQMVDVDHKLYDGPLAPLLLACGLLAAQIGGLALAQRRRNQRRTARPRRA